MKTAAVHAGIHAIKMNGKLIKYSLRSSKKMAFHFFTDQSVSADTD